VLSRKSLVESDYHRDNTDRIDPLFIARLQKAWARYLGQLLGEQVPFYSAGPTIQLASLRLN
jgi:hypothetical protein